MKVTRIVSIAVLVLFGIFSLGVTDVRADEPTSASAVDGRGDGGEESAAPSAAPQPRPGRSWYFGVRGGFYSAAGNGFLGGEAFFPVASRLSFNPNVEWVFVQNIDGLATINGDLHYDFPLRGRNFTWVGGGIGARRFAKGGGWPPEWSLGLNLLSGIGFGQGGELMPYVQGKVFLGEDNEFVLTAGLRF